MSIWRCGNYVATHEIIYALSVCPDIFGRQTFIPGHQDQPPWTPPLGRNFRAMDEIALAHDADELAPIIQNRRGADPPFKKKSSDLLNRGCCLNSDHWRSHDVVRSYHHSLLSTPGVDMVQFFDHYE